MRETTKDKKSGLQWSLMEQLEDIDYVDDIALISQRRTNMKEKLLKLDEEARKTGLKINAKKTKSLRLNHTSEATFAIRQDTIEEVQDFAYLVSVVSTEGGALAIHLKKLGPDDLDVATCFSNLSFVHRALGNLEQAIVCQKHALIIRLKKLGSDHRSFSTVQHELTQLHVMDSISRCTII